MKVQISIKERKCNLARLPAFTIMEMLVAMVISGIIIGSGAFLYLNFNRYVTSAIQKSETENAVMLFCRAFEDDMQGASAIEQISDELSMKSEKKGLITYFFSDDYIVRQQEEIVDTFSLMVEDLTISFDYLNNRFQSLEARLISGDIAYPVFMVKAYENAEMFNTEW
jgi:prepilin-type N-terminal cleavage/methylation domain-containing protein